MRLGTLDGNILQQLEQAVKGVIPQGEVNVSGGGGHYTIEVVSDVFDGKNAVQRQRLVYRAIKHLMAGDSAPVHAIDSLVARTPEEL